MPLHCVRIGGVVLLMFPSFVRFFFVVSVVCSFILSRMLHVFEEIELSIQQVLHRADELAYQSGFDACHILVIKWFNDAQFLCILFSCLLKRVSMIIQRKFIRLVCDRQHKNATKLDNWVKMPAVVLRINIIFITLNVLKTILQNPSLYTILLPTI